MLRTYRSKYSMLAALLSAMSFGVMPSTIAQSRDGSPFIDQLRWQPPPPPPATLGEPGGRGQGAGSRGDCQDYKFVAPLVPRTGRGVRWGKTTVAQPNLWIYSPRGFTKNLPVEIRLLNQQGRTVAKQRVRTNATPAGVTALPFPELAPGQTYWWELAVYCNAEFPDVPVMRRGVIQRITPTADMTETLKQVSDPIGQVAFYAAQGLWFDAMDVIAQDRIALNNRSRLLADLLNQADLSGFSTAPLRN